MNFKKIILITAIIAITFGNVYAGKYTLYVIQNTIWNFQLLIYKSYIIVLDFIMYILRPNTLHL